MSFTLEVVSPEKKVFEGEVQKLTVPSSSGILTILGHHTPLFTTLIEGSVHYTDKSGREHNYPIGKGVLEVKKNHVILLIEPLSHADRIVTKQVEEAEEKAKYLKKSQPKGKIPTPEAFRRSFVTSKEVKIKRKLKRFVP